MRSYGRYAVLIVALSGVGAAQSLVEHAAAAAVGTAGSVGGKKISDGLDRVFKKTDGALAQAAGESKPAEAAKTVKEKPSPARGAAAPGSASAVRRAAGKHRRASVPETPAEPAPAVAASPIRTPVAEPKVVTATAEAFAAVKPGESKQEMIANLGARAVRISIPEAGRLVEVYRYAAKGEELGSIRVVNGAVTEVRAAR